MDIDFFDSIGSGVGLEDNAYWVRFWVEAKPSFAYGQETWRLSSARDFVEVWDWARANCQDRAFEIIFETTDHVLGRKGLEPRKVFHRLLGVDPTENDPGEQVRATAE